MQCKLCCLEKEPKSNTHYLTDFIIRTALNDGGSKLRGKGFYWSIDPEKPNIEFKFQQNTSTQNLENLLGRQTTVEENKDAEEDIDFAVSDSFCKNCEGIFTTIENEFADKIIKKFRDKDLKNILEIKLNKKESDILRLFFLLQFWRTSECDSTFTLSKELSEFLRIKILNNDKSDLKNIPLSVTFLETLKDIKDKDEGEKYKTENIVAPVSGSDPYIILLNDFVIQIYEDLSFPFESFYGYNEKEDYLRFLNYKKEEFIIKIIPNKLRKEIGYKINKKAADKFIPNQAWLFLDLFTEKYRRLPSNEQIKNYLVKISNNEDMMKFSKDKLLNNCC